MATPIGGGLKRSQLDRREHEEIATFDERILGSGEFVEALTGGGNLREQKKARLTLLALLEKISAVTGTPVDKLQSPGKERVIARAKAIFCYCAVREYNYTATEAGRIVIIGSAGASVAVRRGGELLKGDQELREKLLNADG